MILMTHEGDRARGTTVTRARGVQELVEHKTHQEHEARGT